MRRQRGGEPNSASSNCLRSRMIHGATALTFRVKCGGCGDPKDTRNSAPISAAPRLRVEWRRIAYRRIAVQRERLGSMGIIINAEKRRGGGSAEGGLPDELRFLKLPSIKTIRGATALTFRVKYGECGDPKDTRNSAPISAAPRLRGSALNGDASPIDGSRTVVLYCVAPHLHLRWHARQNCLPQAAQGA